MISSGAFVPPGGTAGAAIIAGVAEQRVRIVTDPLGRGKRRLNLATMHQADDAAAVERRRDEAVARMQAARAELLREVQDLSPEEAFVGEAWGAMHVLWHLAGPHTHLEPARAIVEGGVSELATRRESDELREAIDQVLRNIDEWIGRSTRLTREQLMVHARRKNRDYYVVGMVESTAEHLLDHIDHIRQVKARLRG